MNEYLNAKPKFVEPHLVKEKHKTNKITDYGKVNRKGGRKKNKLKQKEKKDASWRKLLNC